MATSPIGSNTRRGDIAQLQQMVRDLTTRLDTMQAMPGIIGPAGPQGPPGSAADLTGINANITTLQTAVATLQAQRPATGTATINANLLGNTNVDVTVTWSRTLPDTNYTAFAAIDSAAGNLTWTVKTKTTTNCVFTVRNTAIITLATAATLAALASYS